MSKSENGLSEKWEVRYHMEDPKRITMVEKRLLVDRVVKLVSGVQELFPETEVVYMTMFPRHVDRYCDSQEHMTDNDTVIMDNIRRDVDRDIIDSLRDMDRKIRVLEWWDVLRLEGDKTVSDMKRMRLVEDDGVHLTVRANRCAAVSLCIRVREKEMENEHEEPKSHTGSVIKRPRLC
jgi:hypothetical protein